MSMQAPFRSSWLTRIYYVQLFNAQAALLSGYYNFVLKNVIQNDGRAAHADGVQLLPIVGPAKLGWKRPTGAVCGELRLC
jgi:hypothetical protein